MLFIVNVGTAQDKATKSRNPRISAKTRKHAAILQLPHGERDLTGLAGLKSLRSLTGFKVPRSSSWLFKFLVDVHCSC